MGVFNITEEWDIALKNEYVVWWQSWDARNMNSKFPTDKVRKEFGDKLIDQLCLHGNKYKSMIEVGAMHSFIMFDDNLPPEYSLTTCRESAKDLINILTDMLPDFPYIQIRMKQSGSGGRLIIPCVKISFNEVPFNYNEHDYPTCVFYISRTGERFLKYESIIPCWKEYRSKDRFSFSSYHERTTIQNF